MKKFFKWLWFSSEDPKSVALTIKGLALFALTEVTQVLSDAGIIIPNNEIATVIIKALAIATAGLTILGLVRKLINTFGEKEVVVFEAKKKAKKKK